MGSFAEVLKSEAASEAAYDKALNIAKELIRMCGLPAVQIAKATQIDEQTILELALELGVILPDPDTLQSR